MEVGLAPQGMGQEEGQRSHWPRNGNGSWVAQGTSLLIEGNGSKLEGQEVDVLGWSFREAQERAGAHVWTGES